ALDLVEALLELLLLLGLFVLGGEGVDDARDPGHVLGVLGESGDFLDLVLGEGRTVLGLQDDRAGTNTQVRELLGDDSVDLVGRCSRDGEGVFELSTEEREGRSCRDEEREPDRDHCFGSVCRDAAEPIEKFSHGFFRRSRKGSGNRRVRRSAQPGEEDSPAGYSKARGPYPARVVVMRRSMRLSQTRRDSSVAVPPVNAVQCWYTTISPLMSEPKKKSTVSPSVDE